MTHPFPKNRKGQSIIEYAALVVVIIGAIIIMGPYVVRSWFAHLKGWEDSVDISQHDRLEESPVEIPPVPCTCTQQPPCGTPPCCGMQGCVRNQATTSNVCSPLNCAPENVTCTDDAGCCWDEATQLCGDNASPPCPAGQIEILHHCGATITTFCQPDATCIFNCRGLDANATPCPGFNTGLTGNTPVTHVANGACSAPTRCKAACNTCWVPKPNPLDGCNPDTITPSCNNSCPAFNPITYDNCLITISFRCNGPNNVGVKVQPRFAQNTCTNGAWSTTAFQSDPATYYSDSPGSCAGYLPCPGGAPTYPGCQSPYTFPDFTVGTSASYTWQAASGNGCDAGCNMVTLSYDGVSSITLSGGSSFSSVPLTFTWLPNGTWNTPPPTSECCPPLVLCLDPYDPTNCTEVAPTSPYGTIYPPSACSGYVCNPPDWVIFDFCSGSGGA